MSGIISHTRLFLTGQPRNPWQMLVEPLGSAEPQLKMTALDYVSDYQACKDAICIVPFKVTQMIFAVLEN